MEHDLIKTVILPYANFFIFIIIVLLIAKKPLGALFSSRRMSFLSIFKESDRQKQEAQQKHDLLMKKINNLDAELEQMKKDAKSDAEKKAQDLVAKAKDLADHIKKEASKVAEAEFSAVEQKLKQELLDQVTASVVNKVKTEFTKDNQLQLIDKQLDKLEKMKVH